ncbi:serine hydrolase domain-containing protein [Barrientosiimonas endolithica]|uniref:serine hydrolase domain-containing protein n=1 Tax=Barrientosiimonas endolithica TaxID=1535208 RepID=UPI003D9BC852
MGSVTKGFTGLLYVDAVERGEVRPSSTLGEFLDLGDSFAASATLEAVSRHRSGLPRLAVIPDAAARSWRLWRHGANPYGDSLETLLKHARGTKGRRSTRPSYSNLGFQLLGHALAAAAGTTYVELLRTRLLDPLGMTTTYAPRIPAELRPEAVAGTGLFGARRDPWVGEDIGPAGGIRSTATDLAIFARALLDGAVPGIAALDPVEAFGRDLRVGAGWMTSPVRGRRVTWHNGGTGGCASWFGLDRENGRAAYVVLAELRKVDHVAQNLLVDPTL